MAQKIPGDANKRYQIGASDIFVGRFTYGYERMTVREFGEGAGLSIGAFCSLATNVQFFLGGNHRIDWITTFPFGHIFQDELGVEKIAGHPATRGDIRVGNDVWIGSGATILSGITIGDGAVIAANATVSKDVAPYEIVGGNPAQHIRYRFEPEIVALLLRLRWWDLATEHVREIARELSEAPDTAKLERLIAQFGR